MSTQPVRRFVVMLSALSAAAILNACLASSAQAEVRTGSALFAAPEYTNPSLESRPPATERVIAPGAVSLKYDSVGAITMSYRNYNSTFFADDMPTVDFELFESCTDGGENPIVSGTMEQSSGSPGWIGAERTAFSGSAVGTVGFDGATFTGSILNGGLAGLDVRCARVTVAVYAPDTNIDWPSALIRFDNVPVPRDPRTIANTKPTLLLAGPYRFSEESYRRVRPKRFGMWGDFLAESSRFVKMKWSRWGRSLAIGHGQSVALHGEYRNGHLRFSRTPTRLELSRPVLCGSRWVFTRITYKSRYGTFRRAIPNGCWK
jgi:hypothetical protein